MDSLSQLVLGAAVGVAVMGRRTAVWKAALWGGVCGTLPDLDVLIEYGDPISNMVLHRAETHALFWLSLAAPLFAWLIARLHGETALFRRWWLALWLVLITHPLLDAMTVYGTQLALPFSDHPFGVGSIFIIDPLYTVPLIAGVLAALIARGSPRSLRINAVGLALSVAYLVWGAAAQQWVTSVVQAQLRAQGIAAERVLVTPAALQSVLWRVVAVNGGHYYEGFYSLFDGKRAIRFDRFDRGAALREELRGESVLNTRVETIARFSKGFYKLALDGSTVVLSDLRMGQEPGYVFAFAIAERKSPPILIEPARDVGDRGNAAAGLVWLWRRMWGEDLPPPR
jgi:inner membrane protein